MEKEYIICCGNYRHFIVKANSKKQARERFDEVSKNDYGVFHITHGFTLKDVTEIILKENKNEGNS